MLQLASVLRNIALRTGVTLKEFTDRSFVYSSYGCPRSFVGLATRLNESSISGWKYSHIGLVHARRINATDENHTNLGVISSRFVFFFVYG